MSKNIYCIFDTQVKQGVNFKYLSYYAHHIVDTRPDIVLIMGDWWDMPALCRYKSKREAEKARVIQDLEAGWLAMDLFMSIVLKGVKRSKLWNPKFHFCVGNHDPQVRIPRFLEDHPEWEGLIPEDTDKRLRAYGFKVHGFLEVASICGFDCSHYFTNPFASTGNPMSGNIEAMLQKIGNSFIAAHNQKQKFGRIYTPKGEPRLGISCGSSYEHSEKYLGPQGNHHWRGSIILKGARRGNADVHEYSLQTLRKKYKL